MTGLELACAMVALVIVCATIVVVAFLRMQAVQGVADALEQADDAHARADGLSARLEALIGRLDEERAARAELAKVVADNALTLQNIARKTGAEALAQIGRRNAYPVQHGVPRQDKGNV